MRPELSGVAVRAFSADVVYVLVWFAAVLLASNAGQRLALRDTPRSRSALAWRGWGHLARILGLAFTLAYLYLTLAQGYLEPFTIGLVPLDWQAVANWLPAVAGLTSLWCALLWGLYWAPYRHREDHSPWQGYGTPLGLPAHVINMEMQAAMFRGALIPALGAYWGAWVACLVRALVSLASPGLRLRLHNSQARAFLVLDLATDVMAAACYIVSGNLWASLLVRGALHLSAGIVHRLMLWSRGRSPTPPATV